MGEKKRRWWLVLPLVAGGLALVLVLGLCAAWFFGRAEAWRFVPARSQVYLELDSVAELLDKARDSDPFRRVLGKLGGAGALTGLMEAQAALAANGDWIRPLLDLEARVCLDGDNRILLILDTDWRGIVLQLAPLVQGFVGTGDLALTRTERAGRTVFGLGAAGNGAAWYLVYEGAVVVASDSLDWLTASLEAKDASVGAGAQRPDAGAFEALGEVNDLKARVKARPWMEALKQEGGMTARLVGALPALDEGVLGVELRGEQLGVRAVFPAASTGEGLDRLLEPDGRLSMFDALPKSVSMVTGLRVRDLRDLWALGRQWFPDDLPDLGEWEGLIRQLVGLGVEDLLFSWPGKEFGVATWAERSSPVLMVSVADRMAWRRVQEALDRSVVLDAESNVVLDGVRLTRLVVPELWKALASVFGLELELPWLYLDEGWLLVCRDPEVLAAWMKERQRGEVLGRTAAFGELVGVGGKGSAEALRADMVLYYDASLYRPGLMKSIPVLSAVTGSWRYGLAGLSREENRVRLELNLGGSREPSLTLMPGYPQDLEAGLAEGGEKGLSAVLFRNVLGGGNPEFLYAAQGDRVVVADLAGKVQAAVPGGREARVLPFDGRNGGGDRLALGVLEADGSLVIHRARSGGGWESDGPVATGLGFSFAPFEWKGGWLLYDDARGALVSVDAGGQVRQMTGRLPGPVFQSPVLSDRDKVIVFPRNLEGIVGQFAFGDRAGAGAVEEGAQVGTLVAQSGQVGAGAAADTDARSGPEAQGGKVGAEDGAQVAESGQVEAGAATDPDAQSGPDERGDAGGNAGGDADPDARGEAEVLASWTAGSVMAVAPVLGGPRGRTLLLAAESGRVSIHDLSGGDAGLAVVLDGPVRTEPRPFREAFVVLSARGTLYVIDARGTILAQRRVPELEGQGQWLAVEARDGLICAGRGNTFWGFDAGLGLTRGFPKAGSHVKFANLDGKGRSELFAIGYDNKVYAYEMPD